MRKRNLILAAAVMAVVSLTACGKEGGIIETKSDMTLPTLEAASKYKETEAQTKPKKEEETWTNTIKGTGYSYSYPDDWEKYEDDITKDVYVTNDDDDDYVEVSVSRDALGNFTLNSYVKKFVEHYEDLSKNEPDKAIKVKEIEDDVEVLSYKGKGVILGWTDKEEGRLYMEYTFWVVGDYIYTAYVMYGEDTEDDTIDLAYKVLDTIKIDTKKKNEL